MNDEKMYSADDICKELNITHWTLANWYRWDKKQLNEGIIEVSKLPNPIRIENEKGKPRRWTSEMLEELKIFKKNLTFGRHGVYGKYSNPLYNEKKSSTKK